MSNERPPWHNWDAMDWFWVIIAIGVAGSMILSEVHGPEPKSEKPPAEMTK